LIALVGGVPGDLDVLFPWGQSGDIKINVQSLWSKEGDHNSISSIHFKSVHVRGSGVVLVGVTDWAIYISPD
jgi:hypothetical protein